MLYVNGGFFYCDVKTDFVCSLMDFVTDDDPPTYGTPYLVMRKQESNYTMVSSLLHLLILSCICSTESTVPLYNLYKSVQAQVDHTQVYIR